VCASAYLEIHQPRPFLRAAVLCLDDPTIRSLLPQIRKRVITYGRVPMPIFREHG